MLEAIKIRTYTGEIVGPNKYDGERRAFLEVVGKDKDEASKVTLALDYETLSDLIEALIEIHEQISDEI